jgi:predicted phage terminase large subunit-like protein
MRGRWSFPETVRAIETLSERWPDAGEKIIEDKANGPAVIDTLKRKLSGLIAVNPEGGKESRASSVAYLVEGGNVFLPHVTSHPWVADFIEELSAFPKGAHDDQVDAASQSLLRLSKRGGDVGGMLQYAGSRSVEMTSFMGG